MTLHQDENIGQKRGGRQGITTQSQLSHIALELFLDRGFDETTMDDIAEAAGIGRRTLFRYFSSKNDLPWGDFEEELNRMREHLGSIPRDIPLAEALRRSVIEFNQFPPEEVRVHRERMYLLLNVPSLIAHSALRYASWRAVIADYVASRRGINSEDIEAQTIAWACLGACLSAYEQWLVHEEADLIELLSTAFAKLEGMFSNQ